jgi:ABC-type glutathione transport system ATPase component
MTDPKQPVLTMNGLTVRGRRRGEWADVVHKVDLQVHPGEILGLVGESGSGKSTTAYAAFAYARPGMRITAGRVTVAGTEMLGAPSRQLRAVRGRGIGLVPQNPGTSLTPSARVGNQIAEVLRVHDVCSSARELRERTLSLLEEAGIADPEGTAQRYAHQLSGGQLQRVAIAAALVCEPPLLVLDEPTTALDVTTQAKVLRLLVRLRAAHGTGMLYVTHDLGVVGQLCDRVAVMYAGEIVEQKATGDIFANPANPYTRMLIGSVPGYEHLDPGNRRADEPAGDPSAGRARVDEGATTGEVKP